MTSFGWKRKIGEKVSKEASASFENKTGSVEDSSEEQQHENDSNLWDNFTKRRKLLLLEDAAGKSQRLKTEGETLADAGRYWEALKKWDEALQYAPSNERLYEMKAQVLMELHEVFPAVEAAQKSTVLAPQWWVGYQTLGRAQLGLGEITMAVKSFSQAIHMNPAEVTLWEEDLRWACSLQDQLRARTKTKQKDLIEPEVAKSVDASECHPEMVDALRLPEGNCGDSQETVPSLAKKRGNLDLESNPRTGMTSEEQSYESTLFCREGFR